MKTFIEWVKLVETWTPPTPTFQLKPPAVDENSSYAQIAAELKRCVQEALEYLQSPEAQTTEDRVEFFILGYKMKVWRTKINTMVSYHIGYRSSWESQYHELHPNNLDRFADRLYNERGIGHPSAQFQKNFDPRI